MIDLHPVSIERHGKKRCIAYKNHEFAAKDNLVPLVVPEIPAAVHKIPIAFVPAGDEYLLVAVQGMVSGKNLLVDSSYDWRGRYFPEFYHCYPFRVAKVEDSERVQQVVCVDENSGLIVDEDESNPHGARIFEDDGSPSEMLSEITEHLTAYAQKQLATSVICKSLQQHGLLKEWSISWQERESTVTIESESGSDSQEGNSTVKQLGGLYCIDEQALAALSPDALISLRDCGALSAAYGQMYSMLHLQELFNLMQAENNLVTPDEVTFDSMADHGNISFEGIQ